MTTSDACSDTAALGRYLNDHLAGARAGLELFRQAIDHHSSGPDREALRRMRTETLDDQDALASLIERLGVKPVIYKQVGALVASQLVRLKPNGSMLRRSSLDPLIHFESLLLGVSGKAALWRLLLAHSEHEPALDSTDLQRRIDRAEGQITVLERLRVQAGAQAFAGGGTPHRALRGGQALNRALVRGERRSGEDLQS